MGDDKLGFHCGGQFLLPISTSLSPGGLGGGGDCRLELPKLDRGETFGLGGFFTNTEEKLFASATVPGTYNYNDMVGGFFSWSKYELSRSDGKFTVGMRTEQTLQVGFASLKLTVPPREIAGETVTLPEQSTTVLSIAHLTSVGLEWRPTTERFAIILEAGFGMQSLSDFLSEKDQEELTFARQRILGFLSLRLGLGSEADPNAATDEPSLSDFIFNIYSTYLLGTVETYEQYRLLRGPTAQGSKLLADVTGTDSSDGSGTPYPPSEDLALLQALPALLGGDHLAGFVRTAEGAQQYTLFGLAIARGLVFGGLGLRGDPGDEALLGAGLGDLATAIDEALILTDQSPETLYWVRFGRSLGVLLIGIIAREAGETGTAVRSLAGGGFGGMTRLWQGPDPLDSGMITRTGFSYSPISVLDNGDDEMGTRGTITLSKDIRLHGVNMMLDLSLSAPHLTPHSGLRRAGVGDGPLPDSTKPVSIRTELSFFWESERDNDTVASIRLLGGLHALNQLAGTGSSVGGGAQIGAIMGINAGKGFQLEIGAKGYFSHSGLSHEIEFVPTLGVRMEK